MTACPVPGFVITRKKKKPESWITGLLPFSTVFSPLANAAESKYGNQRQCN